MKFSAICLLLANLCTAEARLADTREQAEERYGLPKSEKTARYATPLVEGARELTFHYQGFRIRCALLLATDGKEYVVREEYQLLKLSFMKDFERNAILAAHGSLEQWKVRGASKTLDPLKNLENVARAALIGPGWIRSDGATAFAPTASYAFVLELPQAAKHEAQLAAAKDAKSRAATPKF